MTAQDVIAHLQLQPHPVEGGFFRETYRSTAMNGSRSVSTAIYYLLTPNTVSALHRLPGDEVFHFYTGDPVRMLQLWPDGSTRVLTLGHDLQMGQLPQLIVPGGVWQGSVLTEGGRFGLLGCTMAPGFDFADYETGDRTELSSRYPTVASFIEFLTPGREAASR